MPLSRFIELILWQILLDNLCGSFPISFTRLTSFVSACTINALLTLCHMDCDTIVGVTLKYRSIVFSLLHAYIVLPL